ncbi:MAG: 2-amino-4-hydroxy-6-hydroxymethyldihydropteridine diphosphokinase [Candidatus Aminicenantes bacterium]|nr:2-amino-4-hydroxy-6-hydroxymethyldihydropteridine diphosphokinase [Candidatus Aminicenantes bacterium]
MKYYLGLGSNLGQKKDNLRQALAQLRNEGIRILRSSSLYETEPKDVPEQPWFYNQVVQVEARFSPQELLKLLKKIEKRMGRKASAKKAPRKIDLDILLAENTVIRTRELVIPHPRLEKRNFVLIPLSEIAPGVVHPVLKIRIEDLAAIAEDQSVVKKLE